MRHLIALISMVWATQANADTLNLVCLGAGAATRFSNTQVWGGNSNGTTAWANGLSERSVGFDDQVTLELDGSTGRIRMPRAMLPRIRGGKDGWFEVKDVRFAENEITGTVQVSVLNSPKLRVDRLQGMISISGKSGDFSGRCEAFDPAAVQRRF
jgi:hypothetical protein